jgi:anti-sigma factor (TIGR02949 family)
MGDCNCEEALAELQRFLDGELEVSDHDDIQRHLSDCEPCMDRAEFSRRLRIMISSKCVEQSIPPELVVRIRTIISEQSYPAGPSA